MHPAVTSMYTCLQSLQQLHTLCAQAFFFSLHKLHTLGAKTFDVGSN